MVKLKRNFKLYPEYEQIHERVCRNISALMLSQPYSYRRMEAEIGVNRGLISKIANLERAPNTVEAQKLLSFFDMPMSYLFPHGTYSEIQDLVLKRECNEIQRWIDVSPISKHAIAKQSGYAYKQIQDWSNHQSMPPPEAAHHIRDTVQEAIQGTKAFTANLTI